MKGGRTQTQGWPMPDNFLADLAQTAAATTANIHRESIPMPQRQFRGLVPPTYLLKPGGRYRRGPLRGAVGAQNTCRRATATGPRGQLPPYGPTKTFGRRK